MSVTIEDRRRAAALFFRKIKRSPNDFGCFIESVVRDHMGNLLQLSHIHRAWIAHLNYCWDRGLNAVILAPFGHGKSSTLAVPLVAWALGRDPGLRAKFVTNDDESAAARVMGVAHLIESDAYRAIFPKVQRGTKWTDHALYIKREGHALDPSVQGKSVEGKGIGRRADLLVFDDVVDQINAMDSLQRKKIMSLVEGTWLSRLSPQGRVLWISTPWHLDDATHVLMQRPRWCSLVQRVSDDCTRIDQELVGAIDDAHPLFLEEIWSAPFREAAE